MRWRGGRALLYPSRSPDLVRDCHDAFQLRPLVGFGNLITLSRARESALRAQAEPFDRHVTRRLIETPHDVRRMFERRRLAGQQPEHDHLIVRDETERLERSGSRVVVFEEVRVYVQLVEQRVSNGFVPALRDPGALHVAATQMDRNGRSEEHTSELQSLAYLVC